MTTTIVKPNFDKYLEEIGVNYDALGYAGVISYYKSWCDLPRSFEFDNEKPFCKEN